MTKDDRYEAIHAVLAKYVEPFFLHKITGEEKEFDESEWDYLKSIDNLEEKRNEITKDFIENPRRLSDEEERLLWAPVWKGIA